MSTDWRNKLFSDIDDDDASIDGERLRRFIIEQCYYEYVVNTVRNCKLHESAERQSTAFTSDRAAVDAAKALSETAGARAATLADHDEYASVFNRTFPALV